MLEKSLATLFALLILATLIKPFSAMAVTGEKRVRLHACRTGGASSFVFTGDFRSTLDDVDVFALISFLALKNIVRLYHTFFRSGYIGLFLSTICLSVLIALSCFYYYTALSGFLISATGEFCG
ncbi:hypothetical protein MOP93_09320 [Escherichia coli]|uniref:hypothetical protein n=1 Tax=Escherichia coli TaxID=562 RepID=UPI002147FB01|nr:hypothetical protein [Escherichia coli]MCR1051288.1 hypothetical protein [Escherichia coli]